MDGASQEILRILHALKLFAELRAVHKQGSPCGMPSHVALGSSVSLVAFFAYD
jgi:hypothetical protein